MARLSERTKERFKATFRRWQERFSLLDYNVSFLWEKLDDTWAEITVDVANAAATVRFNTDISEQPDEEQIDRLALHECMHLLFAEFADSAVDRYTTLKKLSEAEEKVANRLMYVLLSMENGIEPVSRKSRKPGK